MKKYWHMPLWVLVLEFIFAALVWYTTPRWIYMLDIWDPVQFLMKNDYQLEWLEICGQGRRIICINKKVLQFVRSILQNNCFGVAPGLPNDEKGVLTYSVRLECSGRRRMWLCTMISTKGTMFTLENKYSDDDKMYWFRIPSDRPEEFDRCLKFLLDERNRSKILILK